VALSSLNTSALSNKGRAVALLHPVTQIPIGIRFFILGSDSKEFQRIQRLQEADRLEKQKKTRRGLYLPTPEEAEANSLDLLVGLTTAFEEDIKNDEGGIIGQRLEIELNEGEVVACSPEVCRRIYSDLGFKWLREQIDAEIGDRRDFLPSAK
jgi:hypothetical protein